MSVLAMPKRGYMCAQLQISHFSLQLYGRFHGKTLRNRYWSFVQIINLQITAPFKKAPTLKIWRKSPQPPSLGHYLFVVERRGGVSIKTITAETNNVEFFIRHFVQLSVNWSALDYIITIYKKPGSFLPGSRFMNTNMRTKCGAIRMT